MISSLSAYYAPVILFFLKLLFCQVYDTIHMSLLYLFCIRKDLYDYQSNNNSLTYILFVICRMFKYQYYARGVLTRISDVIIYCDTF